MWKKSLQVYLSGCLLGGLFSAIFILLFPSLYANFLDLLLWKIAFQGALLGVSFPTTLILNNLLAASLAAYEGYLMARLFLALPPSLRFRERNEAKWKYSLPLYFFPVFILFLNGFVLGSFSVLYLPYISLFFERLLPHGAFEIPAILLSGSVGLVIAEEGSSSLAGDLSAFRNRLDRSARRQGKRYLAACLLIVVAGLLEGGSL
jgi:hypothetical protein